MTKVEKIRQTNIFRVLLFKIVAVTLAAGANADSDDPATSSLRAEAGAAETKASINVVMTLLLNDDLSRSPEISAKYDLRDKKNAHWLNTVNSNPGQVVIDQMTVIDLDDDNDDDLLVTQFLNPRGDPDLYQELPMVIFRNTGGGFTMESTGISVNMNDAAVDDYNGDGLQDIFIANIGFDDEPFPGGQSRLLLQNSNGTLGDHTISNIPNELLFTHAVCSGDFDNDGDSDLFLAIVNMGHLLYVNDGAGVFTDATGAMLPPEFQSTANPEASFQWCDVGDFNLDGRDDLVLGQQDIGRPEVEIRDASGNTLLDSLVVLYGSATDTLVTDYSMGLLPVTWNLETDFPQVVDIRSADLDMNNCLDIIVSSASAGSVGQTISTASNFAVHFGDCTGRFSAPINYTVRPTPDSANTLVLADIDGDGLVDFTHRYLFDPYIDGAPEVPPVADADYHPLAYINNQSLTDPFSARKLARQEVEQLDIIAFLGLIHGSLP